jgi:hypothetical protein
MHPPTHPRRALTKAERDALPSKDFALPLSRQYPIPDAYHAGLALDDMRVESLGDQTVIRKAIKARYPVLARRREIA